MAYQYTRVSKTTPCPICGGTSNCAFDERVAFCHRMASDTEKIDRFGRTYWVHHLKIVPFSELPEDVQQRLKKGRKRRAPSGPFKADDFLKLRTGESQKRLCAYAAEKLGVDARALESLDLRWSDKLNMACVPMRSYNRAICGMNCRHFKSSGKMNAEGSVDGLFIPHDLDVYERKLIVCEGMSDTAAALTLGFRNAIGRSSCRTGKELVCEFCRERGIREVTIVADRDRPIDDIFDDGVGMTGARELKEALEKALAPYGGVRIVEPPEGVKDLRAWLREDFASARTALSG